MNRIYQGRVSSVQIPSGGKNKAQTTEWEELHLDPKEAKKIGERILSEHHEIFQDAVNYFIVAMAALADPSSQDEFSRVMRDIRSRVVSAWETFPNVSAARRGAKSFKASLSKWLNLGNSVTVEEAFRKILDNNQADTALLNLALIAVLKNCTGESGIKQGGRTYLPRLCYPGYTGSWDYAAVTATSAWGKDKLAQILHANPTQQELEGIAAEMELSWLFKVQDGAFFTGLDARNRIREALRHLKVHFISDLQSAVSARLAPLIAGIDEPLEYLSGLEKQVEFLSLDYRIPRNKKAAKDLVFAAMAFKTFPCDLTRQCLRLCVKKPTAKAKVAKDDEILLRSRGDDPVSLARGSRGFVFPGFTALPCWADSNHGKLAWKEFDIAAFKEALKSLNQFNIKTKERGERQAQLVGLIAHVLGKPITGWRPENSESGGESDLPEPIDGDLLQLAFRLEEEMTSELADCVIGARSDLVFGAATFPIREGGWKITRASLRGFREIQEDWNRRRAELGPSLKKEDLEEVVHAFQRDETKARSIGSVPLFLRLCQERFHHLWAMDSSAGGSDSNPALWQVSVLHDLVEEFLRTCEPVNLTPAEPRHSRRLFMFSDLDGKSASRKTSQRSVEVSVAAYDNSGKLVEKRLRLNFSAPRLGRDGLLDDEPAWLQPMLSGLGWVAPKLDGGFDPALSLMPDYTRDGDIRFLLNFVVDVDTGPLHNFIGKANLWKGMFNGMAGKNLHLHWPGTLPATRKDTPWWRNAAILRDGFTVLANDLGQRQAGAWALLRVTSSKPESSRPVRFIGNDGERDWFAEILKTGMHRLPGEDVLVRASDGSLSSELSGKRGRLADESRGEWSEARELASRLLAAEPSKWIGETAGERSFPEQNDALIALANRRISRLATYHKWSCIPTDSAGSRIQMVLAELEYWQDSEVEKWRLSLQQGNLEEFRKSAAEAFLRYRQELLETLVVLANRVCRLRGRKWVWKQRPDSAYGELDWVEATSNEMPAVRGQRGLSMARIEQLENLRRLFLRINRAWDREPGKPAKFGRADAGRDSGEPCELLLEKIDAMKEQRVNQTAHLILAQALGVRLGPHVGDSHKRDIHDRHGEYEPIPGRTPVDMIVIENLDRYLASQGRSPDENSRLMKWSHRAVRDKIKMLAEEPFGIPVVEVAAAYSSRFCCFNSEAGARCVEKHSLEPHLREQIEKRSTDTTSDSSQRNLWRTLVAQFKALESENESRTRTGKKPRTLLFPRAGGPLFLGAVASPLRQADMNAAVNLGLRAVAAPESIDLLHRLRCERKDDSFAPVAKNKREEACARQKPVLELLGAASAKLAATKSPNFFVDEGGIADFDAASLEIGGKRFAMASGIGLWASVNRRMLPRIIDINAERLDAWGIACPVGLQGATPKSGNPDPEDDIPM